MQSTRLPWQPAGVALGVALATLWLAGPRDGMMAQRIDKSSLPTSDQILTKYEQALGGAAALAKVNTRTTWSRRIMEIGAPSEHVLLRYSKRPGLSIMRHENLDGTLHHWQNGCDGKVGWSRGEGEKITDSPATASAGPICWQELGYYGYFVPDIAQMKRNLKFEVRGTMKIVTPEASVYGALAGGTGPDLVPSGQIREVYLVAATPTRQGDNAAWLMFDKETGALVRRMHDGSADLKAPGENRIFTSYIQYRAVGDGTRMPFQFITQNPNGSRVRGIHTKVEDNTPVGDTVFVKPRNALRDDKGIGS